MAKRIQILEGQELRCPICGNNLFEEKKVQLNTRMLTLAKLDWLNKSAQTYVCTHCGYIFWFAR